MIKRLLLFILLTAVVANGGLKRVPSEYTTIQSAINTSINSDTVLVSPGTYYENIKFNGKKITVGSLYVTTNDNNYILSTIINGSQPVHPDTASCVLFINNEDSASVLIGFTLTGGTGTKWIDEHGAGVYFEGGGVLTALSSPTITKNVFINNEAIRKTDTRSAGGGGIRSGDGAARIINNVFIQNKAMYGGAIVLNYCAGAVVKNNIIMQNYVYQAVEGAPTFGGGGIWVNDQLPGNASSNIISNNTIVGNYAFGSGPAAWAGNGGGVYSNSSNVLFTNNLIWNNTQSGLTQVRITAGSTELSYNNSQEALAGNGNINLNPMFTDTSFILSVVSGLIDAGNPDPVYNDLPDPGNPALALYPSGGTLRNDIGAYGGMFAWVFPFISRPAVLFTQQSYDFGNVTSGGSKTINLKFYNAASVKSKIDSISFKINSGSELSVSGTIPGFVNPGYSDSIALKWDPLQIGNLSDTVLVYHDSIAVPIKISIKGISQTTDIKDEGSIHNFNLYQNYPNPFNPSTMIKYSLSEQGKVNLKLYNVLGSVSKILFEGEREKGEHEYEFNSEGLPSGIYFYELSSGNKKEVKKFVILR